MTPEATWDFGYDIRHEDKEVKRILCQAHEKYALAHKPSTQEKLACDQAIRSLVDRGALDFPKYVEAVDPGRKFLIDARKLGVDSVKILEQHEVVRHFKGDSFLAQEVAGQMVLAVLAHCCASSGLPAVTSERTHFKLQMLSLSDSMESESNSAKAVPDEESAFFMIIKRLPILSSRSADPRFLQTVINAREKDSVNGLRAAFQERILEHCQSLLIAKTQSEVESILRDFDTDIKRDATQLLSELRAAGIDALISKEGATAAIVGTALGILSLGLGTLAGAGLEWRAYRLARQKVLKEHWTSWLHNIDHPRFSVW
jgi:hypothetical protein